MIRRLARLLRAELAYATGRRQRQTTIEGPPPGLALDVLAEVCRDRFGTPPRAVSYTHLSSWKQGGAFRVFLLTEDGRRRSLVYKDSLYDSDSYPALTDAPVRPGPPEYEVYRSADGPLAPYLPAVYLAVELVPDRHYRYLLEDLAGRYRLRPGAVADLAGRLPELHRALADWSASRAPDRLLRFGDDYPVRLCEYAEQSLGDYARVAHDAGLEQVWSEWPRISELLATPSMRNLERDTVIHGDLDPFNILVDLDRPQSFKLIDWEWAGVGSAHADLASLLKYAAPAVEDRGLARFAERVGELPESEHRQRYLQCQLERSILDAALLAAQRIGATAPTKLDLDRYVELSMERAARVSGELAVAA